MKNVCKFTLSAFLVFGFSISAHATQFTIQPGTSVGIGNDVVTCSGSFKTISLCRCAEYVNSGGWQKLLKYNIKDKSFDEIDVIRSSVNGQTNQELCEMANCRDITVSTEGHRSVTYHILTVTRDLELELSQEGTSSVAAVFKGRDVENSTVNDYVGSCSIGRF